jgi:peptide/nickel transport system permease protein
VDAVLSVPRVLLLIALVASTGPLSVGGIILLLGLTGWPLTSRLVRGEVRALRQREFVLAARATGVPEWRILVFHVLPGVVPQLLVAATLAFATVIPLEAGLSFLGLGVPPPAPSWGSIINDGAGRPIDTWWLVVFPGLAIVCVVLAVNTVGEKLRETVDPRQLLVR